MTNEMTNEEAIAIMIVLKQSYINLRTKSDLKKKTVKENIKAYDMSIKALETISKYKDAYNKGWDDGAKASYEHLKMCEEEQEPCEVESGKLQQAYNKGFEDCRQAVLDIDFHKLIHTTTKPTEMIKQKIERLHVDSQEPKYCDLNICISNEYNGISCDECEVTKSQEKSGDLISREAVLDILEKEGHKWGNDYRDWVDAVNEVETLPSVKQEPCEKVAQERYADLCEYFGGTKDILKSRKNFKAWLERVKWHIRKAEELYEKYEYKKELCTDAVSRQAVLDEINSIGVKGFETYNDYSQLYDFVDTLSSVNPQEPKTGHWILGVCDECGYDWGKDAPIASVPNFCPNCGARMESEE